MEEMPCLSVATIPFSYIAPNLRLTHGEITRYRDDNLHLLVNRKKLQLVLDLDHTLIHARKVEELNSKDKERVKSAEDVFEILEGTFVVKLRPGIREFIKEVTCLFEVSIYTMGIRKYANEVHKLLVSEVGFPKDCWVIAREDCVVRLQKRLDNVLSHERVVLIVDDKEDVWGKQIVNNNNVIKIDRYNFFPIKKRNKSIIDTELGRVLNKLKEVHTVFFQHDENIEYIRKDVREIMVKSSNISSPPSDNTIVVDDTPALKNTGGDDVQVQPKSCKKLVIKLGGKRLRPPDENNIIDHTIQQRDNCATAAKRSRKLVIKFGSLAK